MKERFKIVTNRILRDSRTERRIIEYNREMVAFYMIIAGAVLTFLAMVW